MDAPSLSSEETYASSPGSSSEPAARRCRRWGGVRKPEDERSSLPAGRTEALPPLSRLLLVVVAGRAEREEVCCCCCRS